MRCWALEGGEIRDDKKGEELKTCLKALKIKTCPRNNVRAGRHAE